jgi:hypothetical protein
MNDTQVRGADQIAPTASRSLTENLFGYLLIRVTKRDRPRLAGFLEASERW